jgi:glycosyltransferase involved in cell wall biosynthesis
MPESPKVSIAVTVYNLEQYVEQCIHSVLSQKTDFDYEIIIGDDHSTDNSREILVNLKNSYPDKIKLVLNDENVGININFMNVINSCSG